MWTKYDHVPVDISIWWTVARSRSLEEILASCQIWKSVIRTHWLAECSGWIGQLGFWCSLRTLWRKQRLAHPQHIIFQCWRDLWLGWFVIILTFGIHIWFDSDSSLYHLEIVRKAKFYAKTTPSSNHDHLLDFSSFFFLAVHGGQNLHIFCAHLHRLIAAQSIAQITTYSPPNTSLEHRPRAIC